MEDKRKEFMQDLYHLLETHKRFIDEPDYEDDQGDSWDFVLDDCQNIYAKWIHNNAKEGELWTKQHLL